MFWTWYCDQQVNSHQDLQMHIWWGLWLTRNKAIFDNRQVPIFKVVPSILGSYKEKELVVPTTTSPWI